MCKGDVQHEKARKKNPNKKERKEKIQFQAKDKANSTIGKFQTTQERPGPLRDSEGQCGGGMKKEGAGKMFGCREFHMVQDGFLAGGFSLWRLQK